MKTLPTLLAVSLLLLFNACAPSEDNAEATSEAIVEMAYSTQSKEALKQLKEGIGVFELGDQQRARPYFDKAIELDPDFAAAYVYRAWSSRSTQEYAQDTKLANEKNKNSTDQERLLIDLNNAYAINDVEKRLSIGKTMVENYPEMAFAHTVLGQAYENLKDNMNARKSYEMAISLDPNSIVGYAELGESYVFAEPKDLAKAEENMAKVVALMPNESSAHVGLGDVYRAQQKLDKALVSYQKAAALAPNEAGPLLKAGHANTFLGNYEEARKDYQKSSSLSDFPASNIRFTASTYFYQGEPAKGMASLKEGLNNLDKAGLSTDRLSAAKSNLLAACMWSAYHLGDAKEMKRSLDESRPIRLEMVKSMNTDEAMMNHNSRMNLLEGMIAVLEGKFEVAKEKAEAYKSDVAGIKDPTKTEDYHLLLGEIAMKEGNYTDAVAHFEKADLDDMYPKYKLAMANLKAGNNEKANQLLKEISAYNFNELGYALTRKEVQSMLAPKS